MTIELDVQFLPDPMLEFGNGGEAPLAKAGLSRFGPLSLSFGSAHKGEIRIGLVGPADMLNLARKWFERCRSPIFSGASNALLFPDFPGFEAAFRSALSANPRWDVPISEGDLEEALEKTPRVRFASVLALYTKGLESLAERDVRPDVAVCCIPQRVYDLCYRVDSKEKSTAPKGNRNQLHFDFDNWTWSQQEDELLHRSFRRALKAAAMQYYMPIQIARENLLVDGANNQDPATRAWNVSVGLFYKGGGVPWRLKGAGDTCYVGLSFHRLQTKYRHGVYSSLAQAFTHDGEGFALRGGQIEWDPHSESPHLAAAQAEEMAQQVIRLYRDRTGRDPVRVVVHKTSVFDPSEQAGFQRGFDPVAVLDLVTLLPSNFRLVSDATYPPPRGTLCTVNEANHFLYTTGYIPELRTYPGPHVPRPVELRVIGNTSISIIAREILGLTKMNWNSADSRGVVPITLGFAREVGSVMDEVQSGRDPQPSYRYYM